MSAKKKVFLKHTEAPNCHLLSVLTWLAMYL